jgi:tRNA-2-methylthio-N6-dimethylallyladenosine synthase
MSDPTQNLDEVPRGQEADGRDPDYCGPEGVVSRPRAERSPSDGAGVRVYFVTFGCQMNKYDTEMMEGALAAHGYDFTEDPEQAQVVLFNTCSVRQHAEERVLSRLGAFKKRRAADPELTLGVTGCMAQREGESLLQRVPHLDLVVGTQMIDELPALLAQVRNEGRRIAAVQQRAFANFDARATVARRQSRYQGWLTVTRGCDKCCTYCVVPGTRGPEISRDMDNVLAEAAALVDDGVVELTLLGQTIETYGNDRNDGASLARLMERLYGLKARGLKRLRFVTSHPLHVDRPLLQTMADLGDLVCPFLHMPAQHGSDAQLRLMGRQYTAAQYCEKVVMAREILPDIAVASDFISGFCRETEADHAQSLQLIEDCRFSSSYLFKYSVRPGTPAARLADDVPADVKKRRHAELMDVQQRVSLAENRSLIGRVQPVLLKGPSRTRADLLTGRTRQHRIVIVEAPASLVGQEIAVRITEATALSLRGDWVAPTVDAALTP